MTIAPLKNIQTERLLLRPLETGDVATMLALRSDEEVVKYVYRPVNKSEPDALAFVNKIIDGIAGNQWAYWSMVLPGTGEMIGSICLWNLEPAHFHAEIGYQLLPAFHGKGYMAEAIKAVLNYGFEILQLHTITALPNSGNTASHKLLEKAGFVKEGYFRENVFYDGKFWDTVVYTIIKH